MGDIYIIRYLISFILFKYSKTNLQGDLFNKAVCSKDSGNIKYKLNEFLSVFEKINRFGGFKYRNFTCCVI